MHHMIMQWLVGHIYMKESYICCCCRCCCYCFTVSGLTKRIVAASMQILIFLWPLNWCDLWSQRTVTDSGHQSWHQSVYAGSWSSGSSKDIFADSLGLHNLMVLEMSQRGYATYCSHSSLWLKATVLVMSQRGLYDLLQPQFIMAEGHSIWVFKHG